MAAGAPLRLVTKCHFIMGLFLLIFSYCNYVDHIPGTDLQTGFNSLAGSGENTLASHEYGPGSNLH